MPERLCNIHRMAHGLLYGYFRKSHTHSCNLTLRAECVCKDSIFVPGLIQACLRRGHSEILYTLERMWIAPEGMCSCSTLSSDGRIPLPILSLHMPNTLYVQSFLDWLHSHHRMYNYLIWSMLLQHDLLNALKGLSRNLEREREFWQQMDYYFLSYDPDPLWIDLTFRQ